LHALAARRIAASWLGPVVLTASAAIALVAYGYSALFVRYVADDYCMGASLGDFGWAGAQPHWYEAWSGRFAATGLETSAQQLLGPSSSNLLPILLIVGLFLATWLALREVTQIEWRLALVLASVGSYAMLRAAPNIFESIFWLTGGIAYGPLTVLMALAAVAVARAARRGRPSLWLSVAAILGFISAGFSETASALQVTGLALLVAFTLLPAGWSRLRSLRLGLLFAFAGSLAGAAVVIAAPGNAVRQAALPPHPSVFHALRQAVQLSAEFTAGLVQHNPDIVVLVVVTSALVAYRTHRSPGRTLNRQALWSLLLGTALASALMFMCFFPALWFMSAPPPDRTLIFGSVILVGWLGAAGWWIGTTLAGRRLAPGRWPGRVPARAMMLGAFLLLACVPLATAASIYRHQDSLAQQARSADLLDQEITAARVGHRNVVVGWSPGPNVMPLVIGPSSYPTTDPNNWINGCMANYYQINSLEVVAP
jgi:hypothetical protein